MIPYDIASGEFRSHYAGFFDPGFGYGAEGEVKGTPGVLEVRVYEDDFILRPDNRSARLFTINFSLRQKWFMEREDLKIEFFGAKGDLNWRSFFL
jgi:deoxycytidine triphosphate deaminase